jgi:hypothetical protein
MDNRTRKNRSNPNDATRKSESEGREPQAPIRCWCTRYGENAGVVGVITQADDEPTVLWEYWHTIKTDHRERREPGCNLELVPRPEINTEADVKESIQNINCMAIIRA